MPPSKKAQLPKWDFIAQGKCQISAFCKMLAGAFLRLLGFMSDQAPGLSPLKLNTIYLRNFEHTPLQGDQPFAFELNSQKQGFLFSSRPDAAMWRQTDCCPIKPLLGLQLLQLLLQLHLYSGRWTGAAWSTGLFWGPSDQSLSTWAWWNLSLALFISEVSLSPQVYRSFSFSHLLLISSL